MTAGDRRVVLLLGAIAIASLSAATLRERSWGREAVVVSPPGARPHPRIDLNRARWQELTLLPGIGESRARRIVAFRSEMGGLRHVGELRQVPGIGPALVERIRERVVVRHPGAGSSR